MRTEIRPLTAAEKKAEFNRTVATLGVVGGVMTAAGYGVVLRDALAPNQIKVKTLLTHQKAGKIGLAALALAGAAKVIDLLA